MSDVGVGEAVVAEEREDGVWIFCRFEVDFFGGGGSSGRREVAGFLEKVEGEGGVGDEWWGLRARSWGCGGG